MQLPFPSLFIMCYPYGFIISPFFTIYEWDGIPIPAGGELRQKVGLEKSTLVVAVMSMFKL